MDKKLTRRAFLAAGAVAAVAATGCAPMARTGGEGNAPQAKGEMPEWNEETDLVVVGSGTALFAALTAHNEGKDVICFEKASTAGGTMVLSGGAYYVPNNHLQSQIDYYDVVDSEDEAFEYIKNCDIWETADDDLLRDYLARAPKVFEYLTEQLNVPFYGWAGRDYVLYPGAAIGRSIAIPYGEGDVWGATAGYQENLMPLVEASGLDLRLNTEVTRLVQDENGAVVGVIAKDKSGNDIACKANVGVILGAGPFDWNEDMRSRWLSQPLRSSCIVQTCTGDGHRMGLDIGADFDNMWSVYGSIGYKSQSEGEMSYRVKEGLNAQMDATCPNTVIVNKSGRRFFNEGCSYHEKELAMGNLDFRTNPPTDNTTCYLIADARFVQDYGFPGGNPEKPEWVREYATLEELAAGEGIDVSALANEIARFNKFCETGVDEDYHRGESGYEIEYGVGVDHHYVERPDLANADLGPIDQAPFYVAEIGACSYGTSGGIKVDANAQVLRGGEPVPGLYACGCNAACIAACYPGAGWSNGTGTARGMFAVNHMFDLGLF